MSNAENTTAGKAPTYIAYQVREGNQKGTSPGSGPHGRTKTARDSISNSMPSRSTAA